MGQHRGAWIVQPAAQRHSWLLDGTKLGPGDHFSNGGIEADQITADSPPSTTVIAKIPNLYGDGRSADMTYYETRAGAKVFAAGAFSLACAIWQPPVQSAGREPVESTGRADVRTDRADFVLPDPPAPAPRS